MSTPSSHRLRLRRASHARRQQRAGAQTGLAVPAWLQPAPPVRHHPYLLHLLLLQGHALVNALHLLGEGCALLKDGICALHLGRQPVGERRPAWPHMCVQVRARQGGGGVQQCKKGGRKRALLAVAVSSARSPVLHFQLRRDLGALVQLLIAGACVLAAQALLLRRLLLARLKLAVRLVLLDGVVAAGRGKEGAFDIWMGRQPASPLPAR